MMQTRASLRSVLRWLSAGLVGLPLWAMAQSADPVEWQLNMGRGVTQTSNIAYDAHMMALWVCVVIGVLVFGAMAYAMFKFRKSKGAVAAQFSHNTTAEIIWTVVPILALIAMAWPATHMLIKQYDTRNSAMTIKVTGYQWLWKYEYRDEGVEITSRLDRDSDRIRQSGARPTVDANPHYLLSVDNPLVVPVDTKIRFVITADDVIHAWWVPALGWKQDAIPGIINEAWTEIKQPGVYRGQCAELCGKDHAFMPIVVRAVSKAEFADWLATQKARNAPESTTMSVATAIDTGGGTASGIAPRRAAALDPTTDSTPGAAAPAATNDASSSAATPDATDNAVSPADAP